MTARLIAAAAIVAVAGLTAGCTGSSTPAGPSASAPITRSVPSTSSAPTTAPVAVTLTPTVTPTVTATRSTAASTPARSTPVAASLRECGAADLSVRVRRGGAAANEQIALITFTDVATTACAITGFPGVSLRLNHAQLGSPATRSTKAKATVALKPGGAASTTLTDVSTCQAAVSDTVRVYPPDSTTFIDAPLTLRGCALYVDPVTPA